MKFMHLTLLLSGMAIASLVHSNEMPIAGVQPEQRLPNAPILIEFEKDNEWYAQALKGVDQPYPDSVRLKLLDQANWYTPFIHPGMNGRYDIRNLHADD